MSHRVEDESEWSQLRDAYGTAERVPAVLANLTAEDPGTREGAFFELSERIVHQGTPSPAAVKTVRELARLLADGRVEDKHWILVVLQDIARWAASPPLDGSQDELRLTESLVVELKHDYEVFASCLDHEDERVFANAAHLLSYLPTQAAAVERIRRRLGTVTLPGARAGALLSLAALSPFSDTKEEFFRELRSGTQESRGAAAIAIIAAGAIDDVDPARDALIEALCDATSLPCLTSEFQWHDGHLGAMAAEYLGKLGSRHPSTLEALQAALRGRLAEGQRFTAERLPARWMDDPGQQVELTELAAQMFGVVTGDFVQRAHDDVLPEELTSGQRETLAFLEQCGGMRALLSRRREVVIDRGLWLPDVLSRFLAREQHGPLDQRVVVSSASGPVSWPAWKVIRTWERGELDGKSLVAALAASFDGPGVVALAKDIFSGAYRPPQGITLLDRHGPAVLVEAITPRDARTHVEVTRYADELLARLERQEAVLALECMFALMSLARCEGRETVDTDSQAPGAAALLARVALVPHLRRMVPARGGS